MMEQELQEIYDSEINITVSWLWDGGVDVRMGDDLNGYQAEGTVKGARRCGRLDRTGHRDALSALALQSESAEGGRHGCQDHRIPFKRFFRSLSAGLLAVLSAHSRS
jgi:hypothetical protein